MRFAARAAAASQSTPADKIRRPATSDSAPRCGSKLPLGCSADVVRGCCWRWTADAAACSARDPSSTADHRARPGYGDSAAAQARRLTDSRRSRLASHVRVPRGCTGSRDCAVRHRSPAAALATARESDRRSAAPMLRDRAACCRASQAASCARRARRDHRRQLRRDRGTARDTPASSVASGPARGLGSGGIESGARASRRVLAVSSLSSSSGFVSMRVLSGGGSSSSTMRHPRCRAAGPAGRATHRSSALRSRIALWGRGLLGRLAVEVDRFLGLLVVVFGSTRRLVSTGIATRRSARASVRRALRSRAGSARRRIARSRRRPSSLPC